jgi:STE24 endopeptidase
LPISSSKEGLSLLNCRSISTQLPDEVKGIYSEEKYQRPQEYKKANCHFELVTASQQVMILLGLLMGGGFAFIDELVPGHGAVLTWASAPVFSFLRT